MNQLFSGRSIAERGTLCQLRNAFGHRGVTTDVMNSFNEVDNFFRFTTEAHVVCLALKVCTMDDINAIPQGSVPRGSVEERRIFLQETCRTVVDEVWLNVPPAEINKVIDAEVDKNDDWCTCGEGMCDCYIPECCQMYKYGTEILI